ncbi:transcriptional repressor [Arthrobacter phage TripleJ]|uniref:Helix-turn-helix DNA binding domain protein n=1 Tax=Arthrobacter phage TripleJ TaxID=2599838 RepID=A0A5J6THR7_9CAUD|nr:transcriptional repressor [Arthrobacter phage TripleJ]QFG09584.1 helix-turn-helix DNA binding domain protein [Arthrobacter phage TripleJ]
MTTESTGGLRALIMNTRGERNNAELSRDCGGIPTQSRLQQMATKPIQLFPDPATIKGLARGLNVNVSEVIAACAKDLGLNMGGPDESALQLAGARDLPESSQRVLISMSRELQNLAEQAKSSH